jgi:YHS domain-containing protein
LPLWRVVAPDAALDPVCGADVGAAPAARLTRDGREVVFCSEACLRAFVAAPAG